MVVMSALKRCVLFLLCAVLLTGMAQPFLKAGAVFDGALQFDEEGKFTVMQLADIQENKEVEADTIDLLERALERYSPDLVVLTGDNIKGLISSNSFREAVDQFLAPLMAANVKFAITFGNHDDLGSWPVNPGSREEQYGYYKTKGGALFVDHDVPSLDGTGSGSIPIYPYGQTSGAPAFQLFLMDSGGYVNVTLDLDNVKTSQIDFYIATNPTVPCLWFQHIPVPDIYDLLTKVPSGTPDSYEGSHEPFKEDDWALNASLIDWKASGGLSAAEIYKEAPGPTNLSDYRDSEHRSSAQHGSKTVYETWMANGNMKGAFFGHNHKNSFVGTTADGITLGYAKGATLEAYNDGDPGLRVFEINKNGSYTTISATLSSLRNYAPGDYAAVNSAIAATRAFIDGKPYYRANDIHDPGYYNPAGTAAGEGLYLPEFFDDEAAALESAIGAVEHNLDIRYQSVINGFASSIVLAWRELRLKNADYTTVHRLEGYTDATAILAPPYYAGTHGGQMLPRQFYTVDSLAVWDACLNAVPPGLKLPGQAVLDGFALALQEAYQALRLKPEFVLPRLGALPGSQTVVAADGLLYGLAEGITQAMFEKEFVCIYGNGRPAYSSPYGGFGTGTAVNVEDKDTGEVVSSHFLVVFGDVNGDGRIDAVDADICAAVQNWLMIWDETDQRCFFRAGDINNDGRVDSVDADLIGCYANWLLDIDQVTGAVL